MKNFFEEAKRGRGGAIELDSTQDICHFYYGTSETSAFFDQIHATYSKYINVYWSLLNGRLFVTQQFSDTQRIISETTHGPQASNSLLVLSFFRDFQIKSKRETKLII